MTNVFTLTFRLRFSPSGSKTHRTTVAKIKFLKSALDEEDRQLGDVLKRAVVDGEAVHCFIYATEPPELKMQGSDQWGWLTHAERDHIFILPVSMVKVREAAEDGRC